MATLVETLHGKWGKYEIYRHSSFFGNVSFTVYREGRSYYSCSSLSHAVEYVRRHDPG